MKTNRWIIVLVCIVWGCASQKDVSLLDQRLIDMKTDLAQLKVQVVEYENNTQKMRNQTAALFAELETLKDQVQVINGKVEESIYLSSNTTGGIESKLQAGTEATKKIETSVDLNSDRIAKLEKYLGLESSGKLAASVSPAHLDKETLSDAATLYTHAKEAFDRNDFEIARQGFQQFLQQFPASADADNAQFWMGEIYYQEKWYEKAILEYQKVIEKYPKGNKTPAALLKQGLAFNNLGDKANSRLVLQELIHKFPKTPEADIGKKNLKELD